MSGHQRAAKGSLGSLGKLGRRGTWGGQPKPLQLHQGQQAKGTRASGGTERTRLPCSLSFTSPIAQTTTATTQLSLGSNPTTTTVEQEVVAIPPYTDLQDPQRCSGRPALYPPLLNRSHSHCMGWDALTERVPFRNGCFGLLPSQLLRPSEREGCACLSLRPSFLPATQETLAPCTSPTW